MYDSLFVTMSIPAPCTSFMVLADDIEVYGDDFLFTLEGRPVLYFPRDLVINIRYREDDGTYVSIMDLYKEVL